MKRYLAVMLVMLTGCANPLMKRSEQDGMKASQQIATEHELTVRRVMEPGLVLRGQGSEVRGQDLPAAGRETLEVHDVSKVAGNGEIAAHEWYKQTFPLWVALIGLGVGIMVLVFAIKYARRSSPAIDQAWQAADAAVAGVIRNLRSKAASSTDAAELAQLNAHIADLEGERGRMKT